MTANNYGPRRRRLHAGWLVGDDFVYSYHQRHPVHRDLAPRTRGSFGGSRGVGWTEATATGGGQSDYITELMGAVYAYNDKFSAYVKLDDRLRSGLGGRFAILNHL